MKRDPKKRSEALKNTMGHQSLSWWSMIIDTRAHLLHERADRSPASPCVHRHRRSPERFPPTPEPGGGIGRKIRALFFFQGSRGAQSVQHKRRTHFLECFNDMGPVPLEHPLVTRCVGHEGSQSSWQMVAQERCYHGEDPCTDNCPGSELVV
jgi:hypothetical protein